MVTKRFLRKENAELKLVLKDAEESIRNTVEFSDCLEAELLECKKMFPLRLGEMVYDLRFRNTNGTFSTAFVSADAFSLVPRTVTEKNYFKIVSKYNSNRVFKTAEDAEKYVNSL